MRTMHKYAEDYNHYLRKHNGKIHLRALNKSLFQGRKLLENTSLNEMRWRFGGHHKECDARGTSMAKPTVAGFVREQTQTPRLAFHADHYAGKAYFSTGSSRRHNGGINTTSKGKLCLVQSGIRVTCTV